MGPEPTVGPAPRCVAHVYVGLADLPSETPSECCFCEGCSWEDRSTVVEYFLLFTDAFDMDTLESTLRMTPVVQPPDCETALCAVDAPAEVPLAPFVITASFGFSAAV